MPSAKGASELTARSLDTATLITYQKGAVVSMTIIEKDQGTVTLFSFDEGQGLSEHTAPYDALILVLDGEAVVWIAGVKHIVRAGGFIIMPADEPHSMEAVQRFKMMLVMIHS